MNQTKGPQEMLLRWNMVGKTRPTLSAIVGTVVIPVNVGRSLVFSGCNGNKLVDPCLS